MQSEHDHFLHRLLDEEGPVEVDLEGRARRQLRAEPLEFRTHRARDLERVGLRHLLYPQADSGHAVRSRHGALVLGREPHVGDLAQADEVSVRPRGRSSSWRKSCSVSSPVSVRSVSSRCDDSMPAGRKLHVLAPERVLDVEDRELPRGERLAVDPDAHCVAPRSAQPDPGHPGHDAEPLGKHAVRVVRELEHAHRVARQVHVHDRFGVGSRPCRCPADRPPPAAAPATRATRSRTSFAASSTDRLGIELEVDARAAVDALRGDLGHALEPATRSSMTCVIFVSTTSADAPR